MYHLFLNIYIF